VRVTLQYSIWLHPLFVITLVWRLVEFVVWKVVSCNFSNRDSIASAV